MPRFLAAFYDDEKDDADDEQALVVQQKALADGNGAMSTLASSSSSISPPTHCCVDARQTYRTTVLVPDTNASNEPLRVEMIPLVTGHNHNCTSSIGEGTNANRVPGTTTNRRVVRTTLPGPVSELLLLDRSSSRSRGATILQVLSVEGPGGPPRRRGKSTEVLLPRVAIATPHTVVIIQLAYDKDDGTDDADADNNHIEGRVVSVTEPLESLYDGSVPEIVQVRPAPQHSDGYSVLCPPTSLAILTKTTGTSAVSSLSSSFALRLWHAATERLTTPLEVPAVSLEDGDQIVDFAFGQSNQLSLLSAISVILLHANGNVSTASPVVFAGTIVTRALLQESLDYLAARGRTEDRDSAAWRQCQVARTYLDTVWASRTGGLATARLTSPIASFEATQSGPVLFGSLLEDDDDAESNEWRPAHQTTLATLRGGPLTNVAMANDQGRVHVLTISPTALIPRFSLESYHDKHDLNDAVCTLAAIVERVDLGFSATKAESRTTQLVPDTLDPSLLHVVTPTMVATVSTNATTTTRDEADTTAWANVSLAASATDQIVGVVLTTDPGSTLLVRLSDGSTTPISIAEARYRHLLLQKGKVIDDATPPLALTASPANPTSVLESTPPLHQTVQPLLDRIQSGLSQLSRIVGSKTPMADIDPATLAVALKVTERCDDKLVMPLRELRKLLESRQNQLRSALEGQQEQLQQVQKTMETIRQRSKRLDQQVGTVQANAQALGERSRRLDQAHHDLTTALTAPERKLQEFVRLWDIKSREYEAQATRQAQQLAENNDDDDDWTCVPSRETLELERNDAFLRHAHDILNGQKTTLVETRNHIQKLQQQAQSLLRSAGLEDNSTTAPTATAQ